MDDTFSRARPCCMSCGSAAVCPIALGFPTQELEAMARRGEVVVGGCKVSADRATWNCADCGANFGAWAEGRCDDLLRRVCERVSTRLGPRQPGRPEAQLQDALANAIRVKADDAGRVGMPLPDVHTGRSKLGEGWDPLPGAIDVHVQDSRHGCLHLVAELKVDAIEQQLWDALKLATALLTTGPRIYRGYLIAAATPTRFGEGQLNELFDGPVGHWCRHDATELLKRNASAWRHELKHGRGRPQWIPRAIFVNLLDTWKLEHWPGDQLRLVAIEICDPHRVEMIDGCWPAALGYPSVAYEPRSVSRVASLPWPPEGDAPLTFADVPARLPRNRAHEAMRLAWPRFVDEHRARVCQELRKRGWDSDEFDDCEIDPPD